MSASRTARARRRVECLAALGTALLGGCNFAPRYDPPQTHPPAAFKEAVPAAVDAAAQGWKLAEPRDAMLRDAWWEMYGDPELDALEARVAISNQTIAAAAASYRAAYALAREAQAQLFPTLSLAPSATRQKSSAALSGIGGGITSTAAGGTTTQPTTGTTPGTTTGTTAATTTSISTSPHNIFDLPLEASYQLDLWGSIRDTVAENRLSAQASAAQLANALLSTQSTLAQDYFQLRVADEQRRILETTVADYELSLRLVRALVANGVNSEADVATAESQLESARASATDAGVARAQYEHAIAVLIGVPPAQFSIPYRRFDQALPVVPVGVPSDLLERRPDIAAAERQVAESNAAIGVARAAFFPSLTLSASGGYEATALSNLFMLPNRFWSIGASVAQSVFDGGARRAALAQARALNESQVATYRQTVLAAFQSVEDNLAALRILGSEVEQAHRASAAAQRALKLTLVLYRNGVDSYVNVITAQNTFLSTRETELGIELRQLTASVNLINDLGGGWRTRDLPAAEHLGGQPAAAAAAAAVPGVPDSSAPAVPNPPPLPPGEVDPDDVFKGAGVPLR